MFKKIFKRDKDNHIAILDIGTSQIKTIIANIDHNFIDIKNYSTYNQNLNDMYSANILDLDNVSQNICNAISDIENNSNIMPNFLLIGISGETVKSHNLFIDYERTNYVDKIHMTELQNIVNKLQWKSFKYIKQKMSQDFNIKNLEIKLINSIVNYIEIDGQRVLNPLDFKGKNVGIGIFNIFAPIVHYESIIDSSKHLHKNILSIVATPYSLSKLSEIYESFYTNNITIDIGAGTTDVTIILNNTIQQTYMFSIGGNNFTKHISKYFGITFLEAEKLKKDYSNNKLTKENKIKMDTAVTQPLEIWIEGFLKAIENFNINVLPNDIYLCGGGSKMKGIKNALEKLEIVKNKKFKVHKFNIKDINKNIINIPKEIDLDNFSTAISISNIARELMGSESIYQKITKNLINKFNK